MLLGTIVGAIQNKKKGTKSGQIYAITINCVKLASLGAGQVSTSLRKSEL